MRQLLQRAGPRTPLPYNKLLATGLLIAATAYIVWKIQESPDQSLQFAFNGLSVGAVYALLALGFTIVYGTVWFFDLYYGAAAALGAYGVFYLMSGETLGGQYEVNSPYVNVAFATVIAGVVAWVLHLSLHTRLRTRFNFAVRLLELRRVLKETGSIYLHCDPTASHYLKLLMDAVFGQDFYRNEITWVRTNTHNDSRHSFPNVADVILFYAMQGARFQPSYLPHSPDYVSKFYRFDDGDERGPYQLDNMASPNPRPNMMYEWKGFPCPPKGWRYQESRMGELHEQGRIHYPANPDGSPDFEKRLRLKRYLNEQRGGGVVGNVWSDIQPISAHANERTGYPTQKPLALLERIIKASSNEGDVILDPFCGCATACVAAERLGRQWVGIDLSPKAVDLVEYRLKQQEPGIALWASKVTLRTDIPRRTDIDAPIPYRQNKHVLYGQQEGQCAGCRMDFPFKVFEVDHVIPQSRGGSDHLENLQLLCSHCNRLKGDRTQEYLAARIAEIVTAR